MQLVTLRFLLLELPLLFVCYYCMPAKYKPSVILCSTMLLYGWGNWVNLLFPAGFVLYDYFAGLWMTRCQRLRKQLLSGGILAASVLLQMIVIYAMRYAAQVSGQSVFPVGIAVCLLQGIGYLIGIYRARHDAEADIVRLGVYVGCFPVLLAPLFDYEDFLKQHRQIQLQSGRPDTVCLSDGLCLFVRGLAEKVVLADTFRCVFSELRQIPATEMSMLTAWMTGIVFSMYLYFELLGYSEMARGLGKCFGYDLPRNFSHPFFLPSVTEFMQSWNVTLVLWFQKYFRDFLFPETRKKSLYYAGFVLMGCLFGMWCGTGWQFLLWGFCIGLLLAADKLCMGTFIRKRYAFGIGYTSVLLHFLWVLLFADNFQEAGFYWKAMLGFGNGIIDSSGMYFSVSYIGLLLIGLYIATDLFRNITERITSSAFGQGMQLLTPVFYGALFLFCFASMLHGSPGIPAWLLI